MKAFFEWNEEISVGIQEIDEQHKQLINIINRLYHSIIRQDINKEVVKEILNELVEYTIIHFAVEESLFRIFSYPDYEKHKQQHTELTQQVMDINYKIQNETEELSLELMAFLRKWLKNHIMVSDKRYAPFLIKQGINPTWKKKSWIGKIWG
ncbi:MAG: hemerythrin family protein [Thiomargarita sp.]|nr:hemerythrin family protein [Thiomargarita sp.]